MICYLDDARRSAIAAEKAYGEAKSELARAQRRLDEATETLEWAHRSVATAEAAWRERTDEIMAEK